MFFLTSELRAEKLAVPPGTQATLDKIYAFDLTGAIADAQRLQAEEPGHPLGYLLEAEARWWKIWCGAAEFKYGMTFAQRRPKQAADDHYIELATTALANAESQLKQHDSAEMHLYAGMAQAALARLYGLRGENRAAARAGVKAREQFQRALQLNPQLADADFGLGLYNYYADTLSAFVKLLSFFMGIPGGDKHDGIRQLERAINEGQLTPSAARFYLALNLHRYDLQYEQALAVIGPLVEKYPTNPLFQLARGDLYGKLGRTEQALACYRAAAALAAHDETCRAHLEELVRVSLAAHGVSETPPSH